MEERDPVEAERPVDRETASRFHEYNMRRVVERIREVKEFSLSATGGR